MTALDEYMQIANDISEQLQRLSNSLFDRVNPDRVTWCNVAELKAIRSKLQEIEDQFGRSEQ